MESIGYVLFITSFVSLLICVFLNAIEVDGLDMVFAVIATVCVILGALFLCFAKDNKPIQYSSKEYKLEYKVTIFQGQTDTTYILTKIK